MAVFKGVGSVWYPAKGKLLGAKGHIETDDEREFAVLEAAGWVRTDAPKAEEPNQEKPVKKPGRKKLDEPSENS